MGVVPRIPARFDHERARTTRPGTLLVQANQLGRFAGEHRAFDDVYRWQLVAKLVYLLLGLEVYLVLNPIIRGVFLLILVWPLLDADTQLRFQLRNAR